MSDLMSDRRIESGERPRSRETIDRMTRYHVRMGLSHDEARRRARESRRRNEQRERGER